MNGSPLPTGSDSRQVKRRGPKIRFKDPAIEGELARAIEGFVEILDGHVSVSADLAKEFESYLNSDHRDLLRRLSRERPVERLRLELYKRLLRRALQFPDPRTEFPIKLIVPRPDGKGMAILKAGKPITINVDPNSPETRKWVEGHIQRLLAAARDPPSESTRRDVSFLLYSLRRYLREADLERMRIGVTGADGAIADSIRLVSGMRDEEADRVDKSGGRTESESQRTRRTFRGFLGRLVRSRNQCDK